MGGGEGWFEEGGWGAGQGQKFPIFENFGAKNFISNPILLAFFSQIVKI